MHKISPNKLEIARGRLIVAVGHNVTWYTFARWAGLSPHTIAGILNDRSGGSPATVEKIITMLRKRGVAILTEDLVERVPVTARAAR